MRLFFTTIFALLFCAAGAQQVRLSGTVTDSKGSPLSSASIVVTELGRGIVSKENGSFELLLEAGRYTLRTSSVNHRCPLIPIAIYSDTTIQIIMEDDHSQQLSGVVVQAKIRDRADEVMRTLVAKKDSITAAAGPHSVQLYVKATRQDSAQVAARKLRRQQGRNAPLPDDLKGMQLTEVLLQLDVQGSKLKEQRLGVKSTGNAKNLFYLSATEGTFDFYKNQIKVPGLAPTPFVSPVSSAGLVAYKFKTIKTVRRGKHRIYTIKVEPRQLTNATVEGEITVSDSAWAILHTRFRFPEYHLQEYNFFEVEQDYRFVNETAWMLQKQTFRYNVKGARNTISGHTEIHYSGYQLNRKFPDRYFGQEVSSTAATAYEQDTSLWTTARLAPLNNREARLVRHTDSLNTFMQSDQYLDSLERQINRITWQKLGLFGQSFWARKKERYWHLPSLVSLYQPVAFGGSRINVAFAFKKTAKSRKDIFLDNNISYGIRNNDINGFIKLRRTYNPFNRGYYEISGGRAFQAITEGDAWINMIKRNNIYLNNYLQVAHGLELVNGLMLHTELETAFRRSVAGYRTGHLVDSVFGNVLDNNFAVAFAPYNALYGQVKLQYTPFQRFRREPREKVILGSKWPTFYALWRKGIPGTLNSKVSFDFIEYGAEQHLNLGLMGLGKYTVKSGSFVRRPELRLIDYQFQRRGDPFLFLNPHKSFQALDSTFALFSRYVESHYVHEFNGLFLNKIPLLKRLQLREMGGAGFLIAPERNLRYAELFAGVERAFQSPFNPLDKFKVGIYVVGSMANQFHNPVQLKVGFTTWDKRRNRWF
ncbi:DUF5686 family protein [Pseudocnuella soli]|uniref:DUF5686 family protein n=1 Tax=Pseudocnuella soli TaxID=2502779 RepID=UPI00104DC3BC|nr:DUF5686 family protein [Pseudocnuella soli]